MERQGAGTGLHGKGKNRLKNGQGGGEPHRFFMYLKFNENKKTKRTSRDYKIQIHACY